MPATAPDALAAEPQSEPVGEPPARRVGLPVGVTPMLGFAALWVALAVLRPTTTYHLAPVLVAGAYPWVRWQHEAPRSTRAVLGEVAVSAAVATAVTLALGLAGVLDGGVLVGGDAARESLLFIAATALGLGVSGIHRV